MAMNMKNHEKKFVFMARVKKIASIQLF